MIAPAPTLDSAALAELEDVELCEMLVGLFAGEASLRLDQLALAIADGEPDTVAALAHRLRGTAATIGAEHVARLCDQLAQLPVGPAAVAVHARLVAALDDALSAMDASLDGSR